MAASTAPALDTPELLRLDPKVALCVIASYHNDENIVADYVTVTVPTVISGRRSNVVFTPSAQGQQGGLGREYIGTYDLTYNRLDYSTFFSSLDATVNVGEMPTTSRAIAQSLGEKYDIVFTADDVEESPVTENMTSVTLRAPARSLRWVGEVTVNIVYHPHLENVIIPRDLPGFELFEISSLLSDNFQGSVLNGVQRPDITDYLPPGDIGGHWLVAPTNLVTDHTLPTKAMFEQALFNTAGVKFKLEDFDIGQVQPSDNPAWEVMVQLTPRPGGLYTGVTVVYFNRSDLALFFNKGEAKFITDETVDQNNIVDFLNAEANLSLVTEDVVYTTTGELTGTVQVTSDNLAWKGTVPVSIILPWDFTPVVENMVLITGTEYYRFVNLESISEGPDDTGLPIDPLDLKTWSGKIDGQTAVLTKPDQSTRTISIPEIDAADHFDFTFDQNGNLIILFTVGGNIKLRWYNPQSEQIVVDDFGPGVTPYISPTSWNTFLYDTEVLLLYSRAGDIRYRRQNDRFDTEYSLGVADAADILHVEVDATGALIAMYYDTATNTVRSVASNKGGIWTVEPIEVITTDTVGTLEVRDAIVSSQVAESLEPTVADEVDEITVAEATIRTVSPTEEMTVAVTDEILQLRVSDGTLEVGVDGDEIAAASSIETFTVSVEQNIVYGGAETDEITASSSLSVFTAAIVPN